MPSFRPVFFAACTLAASLLLSACSDSNGGDGDTLRVEVGVVQSLSGTGAAYGKSALEGIQLAVKEINESDADVEMSITLLDDQSSVDIARSAYDEMVKQDVTAIVGPTLSNVALEVQGVAQAASIPVLSATTTALGIAAIGDYVFQVALTEDTVVPATLQRVHEEQPIQNAVLILDSRDAFSRGSADAMRKGMGEIGGAIVTEIDTANADLAQALDAIGTQPVDAFLVTPLVDEAANIVKAIRGAGFQQRIIGGNSFNTLGIADAAGSTVEGAYVGAAWNPGVDSAESKRFVEAYTEEYGRAPELFAAQGYSAVYLLLDAVERAESTDHAAVRDALAAIDGVETPLGSVSFSDQRTAEHEPVVQRYEGGQLVVVP